MSEVCVRVAVRIRPLLPKEVLHNHQVCVRVVPGSGQAMLRSNRIFSFDYAFGPTATQDEVYESCVRPLVESLVDGYNATVFCYGQTGSGKTYTLGGGNLDEDGGFIDRVAQDVFLLLGEKSRNNDAVEATVRVSYMELYKEELWDLLELPTTRKELHIREDERGHTVVVGAKEIVVTSVEELLSVVETGNTLRHTGITEMNEHSSRSHAILTLQLIQCCQNNNSSVCFSKFCLVDLAGSERAGKTGNTGSRLKESVHINTGLLALGNVIRALSDPARNRRGNSSSSAHIPYRDAKITRLLRDSLGGTAHTLMVACVSPSHHSVAETMNVLQFASKARHIRNCPRALSSSEVKLSPTTWDPGEARLGELEHEVQILRELLNEKEREMVMERERTGRRADEGDSFKQPSQPEVSEPSKKMNQSQLPTYCLLAQEAAVLLADISGLFPSHSFKQQLQDWQERLTAVQSSHQIDVKNCLEADGDLPDHATIFKLREDIHNCQKALKKEEQLLEQTNEQLRHVQKEVEKLLQKNQTYLKALEEEKERSRIQTEQLVNQQILIDRLCSDLTTLQCATSRETVETAVSGNLGRRPYSVPLTGHSCGHRTSRKIYSSPPSYSLERVMAAFKMRGNLLLAEIEEKDEVYCPFIERKLESNDRALNKKEDDNSAGREGFKCPLNQTWTFQQKKSNLKGKIALGQKCNGNTLVEQPERAAGTKENSSKQSHVRKGRLRGSVTQRRIQDLSHNMRMKEKLIKDLDKTDKEAQAIVQHVKCSGEDREADVLAHLSMQSQQVRTEMFCSLQHLRIQRAQLQSIVRQQNETSDNNAQLEQNGQRAGDVTAWIRNHQEDSEKRLCGSKWLEVEEERVLQKRAELQELEEELRRREEVLLRREACLNEKNELEIKMLRSSQALTRDLMRVSMQLESVEEQLQSRSTVGVTKEELEKERDMLKNRRDTLDAQLKENKVLNVEEEHQLLQLDEAIEALDTALEFKNLSIQERQNKLLITDSFSHHSQSTEPAQLCDVTRKLKKLSPTEALELIVKYFNKVVSLREAEHHLRLRCEELELHAGEQEAVLNRMQVSMQRLALDADLRLTQQNREHQNNIQLLLQKLQKGATGDVHKAINERLQYLEKELYFYKSSSRQLKKKLKDVITGALQPDGVLLGDDQPAQTQDHRQTHNMEIHEDVQTGIHTGIAYPEIDAEQTDQKKYSKIKKLHQTPSSFETQSQLKPSLPESKKIRTHSKTERETGHCEEPFEIKPVRLCRRELRQISPADQPVSGSATRRRQPAGNPTTASVPMDSIEGCRNTDR